MIIKSPAKVNLHLSVLDKRNDGFHNLESLFVTVNFGDTLYFELFGGKKGLELIIEGPKAADLADLPAEKNIIYKAVSIFREKTKYNEGLKIRAEKRIPAGGGLGGGSSNAASTLLALNKLAGFPLSKTELLETGAVLGSDVPFFICQIPAAWVTGRGEHIEPLAPPPWHFVLVNPGFNSNTGRAFALLSEKRNNLLTDTDHQPVNPKTLFHNDFLAVLPEKTTYNQIISRLTNLGADFSGLSGTGSTCFGAFKEKTKAERAAASLIKEWDFVQTCSVEKNQ